MRSLIGIILTLALLIGYSSPVLAKSYSEDYVRNRSPFLRDRNPYKPTTIYGVHKAYRSFVFRKDGIDEKEALIIAQYNLVEDDLYRSFDFRKPKIIAQNEQRWEVRFPGKYSLMYNKVNIIIYEINKINGQVLSFRQEDLKEQRK